MDAAAPAPHRRLWRRHIKLRRSGAARPAGACGACARWPQTLRIHGPRRCGSRCWTTSPHDDISYGVTHGPQKPVSIAGLGDEALNLTISNQGSDLFVRKGVRGFHLGLSGPRILRSHDRHPRTSDNARPGLALTSLVRRGADDDTNEKDAASRHRRSLCSPQPAARKPIPQRRSLPPARPLRQRRPPLQRPKPPQHTDHERDVLSTSCR